jgi:hypothetical protein
MSKKTFTNRQKNALVPASFFVSGAGHSGSSLLILTDTHTLSSMVVDILSTFFAAGFILSTPHHAHVYLLHEVARGCVREPANVPT